MRVVYKATNKNNGKAYIGFDSDWPSRIREHKLKANRGGEYFHNAINKHGFENFEWTVLVENATYEDEIRQIEEHGTFENGYNLTKGGEGKLGYITSEETKQKISSSHKGKKVNEKQLAILRENAQKMKERGHTDDVKKRLSEINRGKKISAEQRKKISENHASKNGNGSFYKSVEYKEKMSKALKGKTRTPEQRERYRLAALNRLPEHNAKIAESKRKNKDL